MVHIAVRSSTSYVLFTHICCPVADVDPPVLIMTVSLFGLQNCYGEDDWLEEFEEEFRLNGFTLSLISLFYALFWLALALTTLFSS